MKTLEINNLSFSYTDEPFLKNINLSFQKGDGCIFLHGRNGSGKSTLLNNICGLLDPLNGNINRDNIKLAYLPYDSILFDNLSVLDNLKYYYRNFCNKNFSLNNEDVETILQHLEINYLDRKVANCSSGEQKKIALACILFMDADIVILDEPFVAIDYQSLDTIVNLINDYKKERVFLITTHSFSIMDKLVNRLIILENGEILLDTKDLNVIKAYRSHDERIT